MYSKRKALYEIDKAFQSLIACENLSKTEMIELVTSIEVYKQLLYLTKGVQTT